MGLVSLIEEIRVLAVLFLSLHPSFSFRPCLSCPRLSLSAFNAADWDDLFPLLPNSRNHQIHKKWAQSRWVAIEDPGA